MCPICAVKVVTVLSASAMAFYDKDPNKKAQVELLNQEVKIENSGSSNNLWSQFTSFLSTNFFKEIILKEFTINALFRSFVFCFNLLSFSRYIFTLLKKLVFKIRSSSALGHLNIKTKDEDLVLKKEAHVEQCPCCT